MKSWPKTQFWLLLIVVIAFGVRLQHLSNPVADWHSWRQADTASVTREYVKQGIDLLHPKFHDLSNIPSGKNNLEGYRMVEFPFLNASVAWLVINLGLPLVETSRLQSILLSLGTLLSLYVLVKQWSGKRVALVTALVFALLPYNIYYSRVILPEPGMLFFSTFSLMSFALWLKTKKLYWHLVSAIALALALLLKPFVIFLAPAYGLILLRYLQLTPLLVVQLAAYAAIAFTPLYFWRNWILNYPEGIPASDWLFNSNGIRLRPAWFRWLGWERVTKLFLGITGLGFLAANFFNWKKDVWLYASWWMGVIAYMVVIATGNVQHDYYQNLLTPIICISIARGAVTIYDWLQARSSKILATAVVGIGLALSWFIAWQNVKGYFNINHWEYVRAGQVVNEMTPPDARVIAPAMGDTQFLFQTNRQGWPIGTLIEEKRQLGATHYITTAKDDEATMLRQQYMVIAEDDEYLLIDLTQPIASPSAQAL